VKKVLALGAIAGTIAIACGDDGETLEELPDVQVPAGVTVSGPFENNGSIPQEYTCDGENISPALSWSGGDGAREYALIVTDPDAPNGTYVHWVMYGIESSVTSIDEDAIPEGAVEGTNSSGEVGYTGPCPPEGEDPHRYEFTIYALDEPVSERIGAEANAQELLIGIDCCVDSQGTLTGAYGR
jgi:Raf kinase inhibitor-like YbhB/YbcL family protein